MKLIVLDDDPTGTQSATGVEVLLEWDASSLTAALRRADSVYLLTNTRAMHEAAAVALLERIRDQRDAAAAALGEPVHVVLRGDSTLRGHVFPETSVFAGDDDVILFVPAFPDGGRTTVDGTHFVRVGDRVIPAHESEYADDPVFPFGTAVLTDYVVEKSGRHAVHVPLSDIRSGRTELQAALAGAAPGSVVVPDAETDDDVRAIASAVRAAWEAGVRVVVRSASPLAAELAGVASTGLLPTPLRDEPAPTLLVCGSHTIGATRQLELVERAFGEASVVDTDRALDDPGAEGERVARAAEVAVAVQGLGIVASDRRRDRAHNTLDHGERVMTAAHDRDRAPSRRRRRGGLEGRHHVGRDRPRRPRRPHCDRARPGAARRLGVARGDARARGEAVPRGSGKRGRPVHADRRTRGGRGRERPAPELEFSGSKR